MTFSSGSIKQTTMPTGITRDPKLNATSPHSKQTRTRQIGKDVGYPQAGGCGFEGFPHGVAVASLEVRGRVDLRRGVVRLEGALEGRTAARAASHLGLVGAHEPVVVVH